MVWIEGKDGQRDGQQDEQAARALDRLLQAVDTLPNAGADAWQLDLLRTALKIARATEAPVDLERAGMAFKALPPDTRARLAEHAAEVARRQMEQEARAAGQRKPPPGRIGGYVASLFGRAPSAASGSTAKERLLRDLGN